MQLQEIVVDHALRELTPRGTPSFPLGMYCNDIYGLVTHYVPWHWHREVEFGYVSEGSIAIEYENHKLTLASGDGFFINSNRLHAMRPVGRPPCKTVNIVFDPEIIAGAPHSVYETKYVLPLVANPNIGVVTFSPAVGWQRSVLAALQSAYAAYADANYGYELQTRNLLSQAWCALLEKAVPPAQDGCRPQNQHIKSILTYIHAHYKHPVTLGDIARGANIGVRTCCRCFRQQIGITPFRYLMEYRVKIAAEQLASTDKSITEICFDTGFNDTSYFAKTFKKLTGYTPSAFRREKGDFADKRHDAK